MVVSTKTSLQPGDCAAIERSGTYFNLRGVNAGFCDPTNQATIGPSVSQCGRRAALQGGPRTTRKALAVEENQTPTPSEIGMLCDGS